MAASNLGFQVWLLAVYLLVTGIKGVSSMKLRRDLGITQKSAVALGAPHPRRVASGSIIYWLAR